MVLLCGTDKNTAPFDCLVRGDEMKDSLSKAPRLVRKGSESLSAAGNIHINLASFFRVWSVVNA